MVDLLTYYIVDVTANQRMCDDGLQSIAELIL